MARAKVHTDRELADRLGIKPPNLTEMRQGRRAVSPETVAALCDVLQLSGEEAREWLAIAVIENPKNASKAELLKRALFACWALGVAALMQQTNDAQARTVEARENLIDTSTGYECVTNRLYIVAQSNQPTQPRERRAHP
jgi:DNA-binding transcriptional regulator YdaS (Cro superfamily)